MFGIGSILPFMAVLSSPETVYTNRWLSGLYSNLGFSSEPHFLFFLGLCSLGAVLFSNAALALNQWITVRLSSLIQHRLEVRLLSQYLRAPYLLYLRRSPAELKRNVLNETLQFSGIGNLVLQLAASSFLIICIMVVLLMVNPLLTGVLGAFIGGSYGLVFLAARRRVAEIARIRLDANLQRYKMVDEGLSGFKELKVMHRTSWVMRRYTDAANALTSTLASQSVLRTLPRYFIEAIGVGSMLLIILYLLGIQSDVRVAIPIMSVFAYGAYRILPAINNIYNCIVGLRFYSPVAEEIERELRGSIGNRSNRNNKDKERAPFAFRNAIELRNISFRFSDDRDYALRNVTLRIPRGAFVGIAGETGSGKSTLADVILGLVLPEMGEFRVDGVPVRGSMTRRWQELLGYVPQDIYLADDTIENNIAFGLPPERIDRSAVREAARLAQLDSFVEKELPDGYQTLAGDRGIRLSGGQRQRIGIARALYHRPVVLVMDEATSMLDGETEARVFSAMEQLAGELTLIVIAHRLTTIRRADVIYLLEAGTIVAQGTFAELIRANQRFRNMADGLSSQESIGSDMLNTGNSAEERIGVHEADVQTGHWGPNGDTSDM